MTLAKLRSLADRSARFQKRGFSLIELVGVISVIAILAAIIAPRVFETIQQAKISQTVSSVNNVRAAVTSFASKYNILPTTDDQSRFDDLLISLNLMERRFSPKVGAPSGTADGDEWSYNSSAQAWQKKSSGSSQTGFSRIICQTTNTQTPSESGGKNFQLDGKTSLPGSTQVVSAVIRDISPEQAMEISLQLDGEAFSEIDLTQADNAGRVVYSPNAGQTHVYVYLLHN